MKENVGNRLRFDIVIPWIQQLSVSGTRCIIYIFSQCRLKYSDQPLLDVGRYGVGNRDEVTFIKRLKPKWWDRYPSLFSDRCVLFVWWRCWCVCSLCRKPRELTTSDSTGTGTGTVPGRNNVTSVWPRNIFCSGFGPCEAFLLDIAYNIFQLIDTVYFARCINSCTTFV